MIYVGTVFTISNNGAFYCLVCIGVLTYCILLRVCPDSSR